MTSMATSLRTHLPFLRRYARSLTGQQELGDAYVARVLETIAADPSELSSATEPRIALYRAFSRAWNGASKAFAEVSSVPSLIDSRIEAITPMPRQAFLLVAVEGFTPEEAAGILDRTKPEIEADLDAAGRQIAAQVATDILVIEDEPLIAFDLKDVVTSIGHTVVGIARTRSEAVALVAQRRPGLVLADVQLADGTSGLDAVRDILGEISVPVIFITAFPEQVLTGMRPEPTFLVSKPFKPEMVKTIVSQALFFSVKAHNVQAA